MSIYAAENDDIIEANFELFESSENFLIRTQREYQANFERAEDSLRYYGLLDTSTNFIEVSNKPETSTDINKNLLRRFYEYLCSFFKDSTVSEVFKTSETSETKIMNYFSKTHIDLNKFFNLNLMEVSGIMKLPEPLQMKMSFLMVDFLLSNEILDMKSLITNFISIIQNDGLLYENFLFKILKGTEISPSEWDLVLSKLLKVSLEENVPKYNFDYLLLKDKQEEFSIYLQTNYEYYKKVRKFNIDNSHFSDYVYINYIVPHVIEPLKVLNIDNEIIQYTITSLNERLTEDELYLKIEFNRFLSGETIKNFREDDLQ
ncbi:MAG: hypothetical protein R3262_11015 [Xanthomarina gelatinilytica]|nr:hypothetical protein [Xanthomarina gelatinilytica]